MPLLISADTTQEMRLKAAEILQWARSELNLGEANRGRLFERFRAKSRYGSLEELVHALEYVENGFAMIDREVYPLFRFQHVTEAEQKALRAASPQANENIIKDIAYFNQQIHELVTLGLRAYLEAMKNATLDEKENIAGYLEKLTGDNKPYGEHNTKNIEERAVDLPERLDRLVAVFESISSGRQNIRLGLRQIRQANEGLLWLDEVLLGELPAWLDQFVSGFGQLEDYGLAAEITYRPTGEGQGREEKGR